MSKEKKGDIPESFLKEISQKSPTQRKTLNQYGTQEFKINQGKFGRYQIIEEIGRGGMGQVHKAYDPQNQKFVALKLLLYIDTTPTEVQRFYREAKATAKLQHPNIVCVYEAGKEDNVPFFIMEYIQGQSLSSLLKSRLSYRQITDIMIKIGNAIDHAHSKGIIHRDLKPSNIMMTQNMEPKVMDFGLAKVTEASQKLSKTGMMVGTLQYMPPEQAQGKLKLIDERSDVYTLGAILYELLTETPPFKGSNSFNLVYQIMDKTPKLPSKIKKRTPKGLENICLKALEKKRRRRYQSAAEFVEDLQRYNRGENTVARPIGFLGQLLRKTEQHKIATTICFIAMVVFISGLAFFFGKTEKSSFKNKAKNTSSPTVKKEIKEIAEKYRSLGKEYLKKGDYKQSIEHFSKCIELYKSATYYVDRGQVYGKIKQFDKSIADFTQAIQLNPQHANAYFHRGVVYMQKRMLKKSLKDFDVAISFGNQSDQIYAKRGIARYKTKDFKGALSDFNRTLKLKPDRHEVYNNRGLIYLKNKEYKKAIFDFKKAIKLAPQGTIFYKHLGDVYKKQNQIKQAIFYYQQYLKKSPPDDNVKRNVQRFIIKHSQKKLSTTGKQKWQEYIKLADNHKRQKNYNQALRYYNQAIALKNSAQLQYKRGQVHYELGKFQDSFRDFNKALELDPELSDAYARLGALYYRGKNFKNALSFYSKAIELDPKHFNAYNARGAIYTSFGQYDKAVGDLNKAIALKPLSGHYANRGALYRKRKKFKRAVEDFGKAIELGLKDAGIYFERGSCFYDLKKYQKAVADFTESISYKPHGRTYVMRAVSWLALQNERLALSDFGEAIKHNYFEAYFNRGTLFYNKKKYKQALSDFYNYLQYPGTQNSKQARNYIRSMENIGTKLNQNQLPEGKLNTISQYEAQILKSIQMQNYQHALDLCKKLIQNFPNDPEGYIANCVVLVRLRKIKKAMHNINKAIALDPNNPIAYFHRANLFHRYRKYPLAIANFGKYLQLLPNAKNADQVRKYIKKYNNK